MASSPSWIDETKFKEEVESQRQEFEITAWGDLPEGKIYLITKIDKVESKYGWAHLLHLKDREGSRKKTWSPLRLINYIKENRDPKENVFLCSLGVQPADKKTW